jgi:hypothetical protein
MAKTEEDLIRRTLGLLGKVQAGQPLDAEDVALVRDQIASCVADLHRQRIVTIEDTNSIDDELLQWMAMYLAQYVAPDFGLPIDPNVISLALQMLRKVTHEPTQYFPQEVSYF